MFLFTFTKFIYNLAYYPPYDFKLCRCRAIVVLGHL